MYGDQYLITIHIAPHKGTQGKRKIEQLIRALIQCWHQNEGPPRSLLSLVETGWHEASVTIMSFHSWAGAPVKPFLAKNKQFINRVLCPA
jgi:hypothetical protein